MIPEDEATLPLTPLQVAERRVRTAQHAVEQAQAAWVLAAAHASVVKAQLDVLYAQNRVETLRRDGAS